MPITRPNGYAPPNAPFSYSFDPQRCLVTTTVNMIFSVTHYLDLHNAIYFIIDVISYQVKLLMFYSVQTTNLIFVGVMQDIH